MPDETASAILSDDGSYRYRLTRVWGDGPLLTWVMLNPSTADAELDDPTIRRCRSFTQRGKFGGFQVLNLFAYRSTDPSALTKVRDPVGPQNDEMFEKYASPYVCVAWGTKGTPERVTRVVELLGDREVRSLGTTKDGHPRHPLYVKGDQPFVPWQTEGPHLD